MCAYGCACAYVMHSLHLRDREADSGLGFLPFFFSSESERTRAKGVVAKEAWGDYKDLGL